VRPERVVAGVASEEVAACVALQEVVPMATQDPVAARPAEEAVAAPAAHDQVVAGTAVDDVASATTDDDVVAAAGVEDVVAGRADEDVGMRGALERLAFVVSLALVVATAVVVFAVVAALILVLAGRGVAVVADGEDAVVRLFLAHPDRQGVVRRLSGHVGGDGRGVGLVAREQVVVLPRLALRLVRRRDSVPARPNRCCVAGLVERDLGPDRIPVPGHRCPPPALLAGGPERREEALALHPGHHRVAAPVHGQLDRARVAPTARQVARRPPSAARRSSCGLGGGPDPVPANEAHERIACAVHRDDGRRCIAAGTGEQFRRRPVTVGRADGSLDQPVRAVAPLPRRNGAAVVVERDLRRVRRSDGP
jgi:hypothetical protein